MIVTIKTQNNILFFTEPLNPTVGAEIKKKRPAVIINDDEIGILPLKVIVPITEWKDRFQGAIWMV